MADPMDYTMDDGHGEPVPNTNSVTQCQYRSPHSSPNSNNFGSHSRDAHHYDPVHNTESWHQINGAGSQSRQPHPYTGAHNPSPWGTPSWGLPVWPGSGEARRGSQGRDVPGYPQPPPGFMGMPPARWGDVRGYEPQASSFYPQGVYGGTGDSAEPNPAGRGPQTTSTIAQAAAMRRYTNIGQAQQAYVERATRTRDEAVRNLNARLRVEREAARQAAAIAGNSSSLGYLLSQSSMNPSHPRRRDDPDWDSDDEDPLSPDSDIYTNTYQAGRMFGSDMDDERRMAAARAALTGAKKVPSKEFVASLEKLDPKDIKEADRTCMICYNEFGVENPDGIVEQPIRLPKCKHVFGDKCIKKWFEDSDSCPYCRDKLPSEHVHRKHPNMEAIYQAHSRRNQLAQAAAHSARARAGYPARVSDDLTYGSASSQYYRNNAQGDYHYIMRGSGAPDPWSHSPPNRSRDSAESRRRQARGRAGLGRPTSVGSARVISSSSSSPPDPAIAMRAHLQSITPNTLNTTPANAPRRSITPALMTQTSTGSPINTPPRSRLSESSSSSEEASPPVAVGSGVGAGANLSLSARSYPTRMDRWADPYRNYPDPNESYFQSGRSPSSRVDMEGPTTSPGARSAGSNMSPQSFGELNFHEALSGNRWSR